MAKITNFVAVVTLLIVKTAQEPFSCVLDGRQKVFECRHLGWNNIQRDIPWNVAIDSRISFAKVDFSCNEFEILSEIPEIRTVALSFAKNWIRRVQESAFWHLTSLVTLDLSYNQIVHTEFMQHEVRGPIIYNNSEFQENNPFVLRNLTTLLLSHNNLEKILPRTFRIMPRLTTLVLSWNYLRTLDEDTYEALSFLKSLEVLDLKHNNLESFDKPLLQDLTYLKSLDLGGNKLVTLPATLTDSNLLSLVLDDNAFKTFNYTNFPRMPKLRSLNARHLWNLESIEEGAFGKMPSLKNVSLGMCPRLSNFSSKTFYIKKDDRFVPNHELDLTMLRLTSMNLQILNQEWISNWNIPFINLEDNPWKCSQENNFLIFELFPQIKNKTPNWVKNLYCVQDGLEFDLDNQERKPWKEEQLNTALYISVPVLGLVFLAILVWCIVKCCKHRRHNRNYRMLVL